MSSAEFEIAYDGDALRNHTMNVELLAPALLAVSDLCREANRVLNGQRAAVSVNVRADFERKCFDIHFELVQSVYERVKDLVSDDHVATAKTVLEWLGLVGVSSGASVAGLLGFRKAQKGRSIASQTETTVNGTTVYNIRFEGDGNSINVPVPVRDLASDPKIAEAERSIVRPLKAKGIDRLEIRERGSRVMTVEKGEVSYFDLVEAGHIPFAMPVSSFPAILELRSPVFEEGERWQFNFGEARISAVIEDRAFLNRVFIYGDRFGAGDKLGVDLEVHQHQTQSGKIRNAYTITKVHRVWAAAEQTSLPLEPS